MTEPEQELFRRLVAAASRVCRLADEPDVFDEYNDSDGLRDFLDALAELDKLLREVDPVPLPPARQPAPTVADVLAVLLALPGVPGLEELTGRLDDEQVEKALRVALNLSDRHRQTNLIVRLAPRLSEVQAQRALTVVPTMDRASQQMLTLVALLPRLPEARRSASARFALAAASRLHPATGASSLMKLAPWLDAAQRATLYDIVTSRLGDGSGPELCWLAEHYLPEQRTAALNKIIQVADGNSRAVLLTAIAPHLDEAQLAVATDAAAGIIDPGFRARALAGVARSLPAARRRQAVSAALTAAGEATGDGHSYLAWKDLFPLLEPDQLGDALAAVAAVRDGHSRAHSLSLLIPLLPSTLLPTAAAAARAIADHGARAAALASLVPYLPDEVRTSAVSAAAEALTERPGGPWASHLRVLAPHLTTEQLAGLWEVALREEREYPQQALATLAPFVDADRRGQALELALSYEPQHLVDAVHELAPHLDAARRGRAYEEIRQIQEPASRARGLARLVAYLSPPETAEVAQEALATAGTLRDPGARAALLAELVPHLDGTSRETALAWAFAAATAIEPEDRCPGFPALTRLVPLIAGAGEGN
ncbi:hypothetical protein DKT69_20620 [Micromonospora sicca]|uniref:Uncharacterized protein n=1 Tax=Micromonospora sicca TaxID=2202420 RepID=A0A317DKM7_9ACTN|nr:hypothetical protein [Micromonospora sp. 4G51]PWR13485.1 hypothetical protein DKT69_20620 [Micromonospora sp. 4G51]